MTRLKLLVKVVPNASRDQVAGWLGQELKVRVQAPPEAGKANKRLCKFLAGYLGLPEGSVAVVGGHANARKVLEIAGMTMQELCERV